MLKKVSSSIVLLIFIPASSINPKSNLNEEKKKKKVILPANSFAMAFSLNRAGFQEKENFDLHKKFNYKSTKALRLLCPRLRSTNSC